MAARRRAAGWETPPLPSASQACCGVSSEMCASIGEHTGSSSQTQGRLPERGHVVATFSRTSELCVDRESRRGVSYNGVSSPRGGQTGVTLAPLGLV